MKIEGDYLVIEMGDDSTLLRVTTTGDQYAGTDTPWYNCGLGVPYREKQSTWRYRRLLKRCHPDLLAMVKPPEPVEAQHFI